MPRFAANLTMLWPELDPYDRFRAAAEAGFHAVEMLFPHELDAERLEQALREHALRMVLFDPAPGNWPAGERGLECLPGREEEFLETIRAAVALARRLGTERINALVGIPPAGVSVAEAEATAVANLRAAAPLVEQAGMKLLVENINSRDMPGYLADTAAKAARLVEGADHPAIRLQLDQYHVGMMGEDPLAELRRYAPLIEHVQIADVPGRHQPGTGSQPVQAFLDELDRLGYSGYVGLEYRPQGSTDESLAWLPRERRG